MGQDRRPPGPSRPSPDRKGSPHTHRYQWPTPGCPVADSSTTRRVRRGTRGRPGATDPPTTSGTSTGATVGTSTRCPSCGATPAGPPISRTVGPSVQACSSTLPLPQSPTPPLRSRTDRESRVSRGGPVQVDGVSRGPLG